jgi:co-chaperonin GroES (HSP10)
MKKTPKAGIGKIVLSLVTQESTSRIVIAEHLKEKRYKVVDIGNTRTSLENQPTFVNAGDIVHIVPNTGFPVKEQGDEYVVCNFEDILVVC